MKIFGITILNTAKNLVFMVAWVIFLSAPLAAQEKTDVVVEYHKGNFHRVTAQFEHKGVVIIDQPGQEDQAKTLPLEVTAQIRFDQRLTDVGKEIQAIRNYDKAEAQIRIDNGAKDSKLAPENQLVIARMKNEGVHRLQMASISDALEQSELELIRNPADPLTLERVFTKTNVRLGDKWTVSSEAIADFLAVDHVYENNIRLALKSIDNKIAKIYITGSVKAEVDDVTTEMELSGIALVDLERKLLTALRATIRENRNPGQIAPGFEGITKIDLKMSVQSAVPELSNDALAGSESRQIKSRIKWESEGGRFQVLFDPRWRIIASEDEAVVLRYVDGGQLLAQCDIVQLPSRPADNPLTLAKFKQEIEKLIAPDKDAQLLKAEELKTATGLLALRIEIEGVDSEIPVQWIYYHVAADDGRRMTYVFTLEQDTVEQFAGADKFLVDATVIKPKPVREAKKATDSEQSKH